MISRYFGPAYALRSFGAAFVLFLTLFFNSAASAGQENSIPKIRGIYLTQTTLENTAFLKYLIKNAKEAGIDTFVVDMELPSKRYEQNIALLKENNIRYVARIIMFPNGGTPAALKDPAIWQKKFRLVQQAIDWGASQIQLDYIRYSSANKASGDNAKDVMTIIKWYKDKIVGQNIPLQVDVFGVTSFGESKHIGQNIKLFSQSVDALCPMVYPSHYWPYQYYSKRPFETVYDSLKRIKKQFGDPLPIKIYAFIEMSNYHYNMTKPKIHEYIKAQIKAVDHANVNGWYAWSAHNRYENLFAILKDYHVWKNEPVPFTNTKILAKEKKEKVSTEKQTKDLAKDGKDKSTIASEKNKEIAKGKDQSKEKVNKEKQSKEVAKDTHKDKQKIKNGKDKEIAKENDKEKNAKVKMKEVANKTEDSEQTVKGSKKLKQQQHQGFFHRLFHSFFSS